MTPEREVVDTYDPASPHSRAFLHLTGQEAPKPDYTLHAAADRAAEDNSVTLSRDGIILCSRCHERLKSGAISLRHAHTTISVRQGPTLAILRR